MLSLVRGGSSTSNLVEPSRTNFDCTEPSLSTSLQGQQGMQGVVTCSGWFKHIEPRRTFLNHIITKIAKCVEFCHMSSGWFDCTEPSLSTSLQGKQGMQGVVHLFGVVQAHRTSSYLLEPHHYKDSKVCRVLSHEFGVVRLYRTFSIYIVTEIARCAGCLCTCSGWFKHIEPRRTFQNELRLYRTFSIYIVTGATRYAGFCALVRGGSSTSNLLEPS